MIESAIAHIQTIISAYGAWGVFAATIIEEVVAPIPSALVPLAAGFFLLPAEASFPLVAIEAVFLVALPVAAGIAMGSSAVYVAAYFGGKPLIERNSRFLGITWQDIERIERKVINGKHDEITLFLLRLVPVIPGVALSGFCGIVRYPFSRFITITLIASGIRAFGLGLIGWQAGEFYLRYVEVMNRIEHHVLVGLAIALPAFAVAYIVWKRTREGAKG